MFLSRKFPNSSIGNVRWRRWSVKNWFAFQIERPTPDANQVKRPNSPTVTWPAISHQSWLEYLAVFTVFAALAATITPGVNESHYLTKAKHFWNPDWCGSDIFLSSADAHWFFFFTCGWPTLFLSLDAVAWVGRIISWACAALAWVKLNQSVGVPRWFSIVSATTFVMLVDRFNMAGEWVIGGFEAKGVAYIFIFWALRLFLTRQYWYCALVSSVAIAFHAVVGIWAFVGLIFVVAYQAIKAKSIKEFKTQKFAMPERLAAATIILFVVAGCLPPVLANIGTPVDIIRSANAIQVQQRLNHHLLFGSFQVIHVARFTFIVCLFFVMSKFNRSLEKLNLINLFCISSLAISLAGMFLSGLAEHAGLQYDFANGMLRYYWFRFSDFAVPLAISLSVGYFGGKLICSTSLARRRVAAISTICLFAAVFVVMIENFGDWRSGADRMTLPTYSDSHIRTQQTYENWKKVCHWVRMNTRTDSVFLTPFHYQTFKWHAHRSEFACWKDIPQDAESIIQWRERIGFMQSVHANVTGGILGLEEPLLTKVVHDFGITHVVARQADEELISRDFDKLTGLAMQRIYPVEPTAKSTFVVYSISIAKRISAAKPNRH